MYFDLMCCNLCLLFWCTKRRNLKFLLQVLRLKKDPFYSLTGLPDGCPTNLGDLLGSLNRLREFWHKSVNAVLFDDPVRTLQFFVRIWYIFFICFLVLFRKRDLPWCIFYIVSPNVFIIVLVSRKLWFSSVDVIVWLATFWVHCKVNLVILKYLLFGLMQFN